MNRILMTGAVLAAFTLSTPALADSVFDGPYAGAQVGFGKTELDYNYAPGASGNIASRGSEDDTGLNAGIFLGFQKAVKDNLILGAEIGYSESANGETWTDGAAATAKLSQNETWEIGGRLGYLVQTDTMVYGRLAWVRTNFSASLTDGGGTWSGDDDFDGIRYGVGVEKSLNDKFSANIDLSYVDYSDETYTDATDPTESVTLGGDEMVVRVGVAYHF